MGSSSDAWLSGNGGSTGGSSSSGAWSSQFGGGSGGPPALSPIHHSGGSSFGFPGGGILHGAVDTLSNLGFQTEQMIHGIPNAADVTSRAAWYSLWEHPNRSLSQDWNDPHALGGAVIKPQVEATKADAVALKRGDWHYFEQHPLNPILDAATVASLGGGSALRAARLGMLGDSAAELATSERLLRDGNHVEALNQARTLQGRLRQRAFDRWSQENPDSRFGAPARIKRIMDRRANVEMIHAHLPLRIFQRLTRGLTAAEQFAFHVAVEGVPLDERIAYYRARQVELEAKLAARSKRLAKNPPKTRARTPWRLRPIKEYLSNLESPDVQDALLNPRQEFIDALEAGAKIEGEAGRRLVAAGDVHPDARAERALLPQKVMEPPAPPPPPAAPPYTGPVLPPTVTPPVAPAIGPVVAATKAAPMFVIKLPSRFFDAAERQGHLAGQNIVRAGYKSDTADVIHVRLDEKGFRHLERVAKAAGQTSPVRAAVRRIEAQRKVMEEAVRKHHQALHWRKSRDAEGKVITGAHEVEGSDYRVVPGQKHYEAYQGDVLIGHARSVGEAKRIVERAVHQRRVDEANAAGMAQSAAEAAQGTPDPFTSVLDAGGLSVAHSRSAGSASEDWAAQHANPMASSTDVVDHVLERAGVPQGEREAQLQSEIDDLRAQIDAGLPKKKLDKARMQLASKESRLDAMRNQQGVYADSAARFHGTRERFPGDVPGDIYSTGSGANNLYGHGFYTTDARDVAATYTHKGGATESQHVYGVHWQGEGKPHLLDLDAPAHPTVKEWARAQLKEADAGHFDASVESFDDLVKAVESGSSGEVIRAVRRMWGSTGEIPKSEVDDMVSGLSELLASQGYDGLKHVGGTLAGGGKRRHNVTIFFDTKKLKLSDAAHHESPPITEPAPLPAGPEPTPSVQTPAEDVAAYELPQRDPAEAARAGVNRVNPLFPAPYRFPHVRAGVTPGAFMSPKTEQMLGHAPILTQLRHNAAHLLSHALMITDPERVLSRDFLSTMRWSLIEKMQREGLDKVAFDPSEEYAHTGFKRPQDFYYRPSYDRPATSPLPAHIRVEQGLTQDRALLKSAEGDTRLQKAANGIVSQDLHDLVHGVDENDLHNLETLKRLGIKVVHKAYGKDFRQEFNGTHWAIRYFIDRPLDVWRMITLNYRPAWMVNNFVGNGLMGLATYGPAGAAAYLRVLLSLEKSDDVIKLWKYTTRIPKLRRKYGELFTDVASELHSAGLYGTQTKLTHEGIYEGKFAEIAANPAVRALGFVPKKVGHGLRAVGRGVTKLEILLAEDTGREAAFIREAGGDLEKIRRVARAAGEGNLTLAEALKRMDRASVERAVTRVNDVLGDFNDLSHIERSVIRRAIPFYSWFKVITKVSAKYAARYPARLLMLKNIREAQDQTGEENLPTWLRGSLLIGKPHNGVQTLISTQGLNPFETLNQVSTGGAGSVMNPFATSFVIGLTGRDPAFGSLQDYYGLGATNDSGWKGQVERGVGSFIGGLAPGRLYSQTTEPYKGKLYAPHTYARVGPVSVNDFLLQYLGLPLRHVKVAEAKRERGLR